MHRAAEDDLTAAFRYYKAEAGMALAGRFLNEFERVVRVLEANAGFGTPTHDGRRSFPLRGFPYSLIYRETSDGIRILVLRHQHRDPSVGEERR